MSGQCIYLSPTKPNRSPQYLGPLVTALGTVHLPLARLYKIRPDAYDSPRLKSKQKERNKKDGYAYLHLVKVIQKGDNRTHVTDIVYHNGKDLGHAMRLLLQKKTILFKTYVIETEKIEKTGDRGFGGHDADQT